MTVPKKEKVVSVHWGFSIGGVGKYAAIIDNVYLTSGVEIYNVIILSPTVHVDDKTLKQLKHVDVILLKSKFDLSWMWKLRKILKSGASLVMTHGFNGHFIMLIEKYILGINIPLVCSYHGEYHATESAKKPLGKAYNWLTEFYIRHCAIGTIAVANYCREFLVTKNIEPGKITVIHNGISNIKPSDSRRDEIRKDWNVRDNELLLGVASRIDPVKGIEFLLDAFRSIADTHQNLKLVIIGTGALEHDLQSIVKNNHLESRVIFTGFRSDIDDCLSAIDIFILPSLAEYHSIALLEAMRSGKSIISTDVGGNTESVRDKQEALIVPSSDSHAIALAICLLTEDAALRECLGGQARKRFIECFTDEVTIRKTADWFERLLQ